MELFAGNMQKYMILCYKFCIFSYFCNENYTIKHIRDMKKILFAIFLCQTSFMSVNAQVSVSNTKTTVASPDNNVNFRLYQTNNRWTFLKLDTRTGIIMHVQYSIEGNAMQYELNGISLAHGEDAMPGRFFLYPTENTFNFILLDQIDGRVWQVQWSIDKKERGIWRIY